MEFIDATAAAKDPRLASAEKRLRRMQELYESACRISEERRKEIFAMRDAIDKVFDRLASWWDGARIAEKQCPSPETRNTMMNYAHLLDILAPFAQEGPKRKECVFGRKPGGYR